jgi:hypothetical protein
MGPVRVLNEAYQRGSQIVGFTHGDNLTVQSK